MELLGTPAAVQNAVRETYGAVAADPTGAYNFRVGRQFAEDLGYPADLLDELPASASDAFTGVATVSLLADLEPGETVVDLGAGGGLDLVVLARKVGPRGRAIGIDFAATMVARARSTLARLGLDHAEVIEAAAERTEVPDASVYVIVINGLLNLLPDKCAVLDEVGGRPGGDAVSIGRC